MFRENSSQNLRKCLQVCPEGCLYTIVYDEDGYQEKRVYDEEYMRIPA